MYDWKMERMDTSAYHENYTMTAHDWGTIKKAFGIFSDYNEKLKTNLLSKDCLAMALRAMKLIPSEKAIEDYLQKYFHNGFIDEETFNLIAEDCWIDEVGIESLVYEAFSVFDERQSGKLTSEVMRDILLKYGEPLEGEEAEQILKKCVDKDSVVFYSVLVNQWKKINIFPKPKNKGKKSKK